MAVLRVVFNEGMQQWLCCSCCLLLEMWKQKVQTKRRVSIRRTSRRHTPECHNLQELKWGFATVCVCVYIYIYIYIYIHFFLHEPDTTQYSDEFECIRENWYSREHAAELPTVAFINARYSYSANSYIQYFNERMHSVKYNKMRIMKYSSSQVSTCYMFRHPNVGFMFLCYCVLLRAYVGCGPG